MWTTVYLSLGSNLGDRAGYIETALNLLEDHRLRAVRRSSLYETEPQDHTDQPWFLNMVAEVSTTLSPEGLLERVRAVEARLGRQRAIEKGPRTVDIDILTYGDSVIRSADLEVPHPRMAARRFVLEPLAELSPDFPLGATTASQKVKDLKAQKVTKLTCNS